MFELSKDELEKIGARITTEEIKQQPDLWEEVVEILGEKQNELSQFFDELDKRANGKQIQVIFTGAGSSQYVGDTIVPYLNEHGDTERFAFHSFGTTDIVASPKEYLFPDQPTLLVSFARSGNSPESLAAVNIADQVVNTLFHLTITCAKDGELAKIGHGQSQHFLLLMPEKSNDAGFAMTGSFTCMLLSALWLFDTTNTGKKQKYLHTLSRIGRGVIEREQELAGFLTIPFDRVAYLGSGSLAQATREAQLKILELTAGKIATIFDSSMGFRHGPKSFVNDQTLVIGLVTNQEYTRNYDIDILEEIHENGIAANVLAIAQSTNRDFSGTNFFLEPEALELPDAYLSVVMILTAQIIALHMSIKVGNTPDTPSPTGTVNRVVKGVTIHEYPDAE
ncbi:SIS domain-containing protein [Enterococcus sp. DIV1298c]|uniref:SIS domain-containing protein n=1 Tax=Enterococcus sp. DIV1298c TaxID=2815328 RepID=UPI001A9191F4|nr:SIS domain-containing protein [Enterococcus sp. DIV1298c]MBO0462100.1 SIS domain-containing protein [Enterococcus sp. DIV1298c]